ncbi:uncharacterized protein [Ptychodera flava]|uniref:uncharacterized protein n=1 Tax=Ptychodera flava TaxID=63121 RepID=UPI00396A1865
MSFFSRIKLTMVIMMVACLSLALIGYMSSRRYNYTAPLTRFKETSPALMMSMRPFDQLRSAISDIEKVLSQQRKQLGVTSLMVEKALKHVTSTSNLQRIVLDAVTRNRTLYVGVAGGSISALKYCYANFFTENIQAALNIPVKLHNAAIGATDSIFYAYCFASLLNIHELDIVLWEQAANDFIKDVGPWAQEDFTRVILNLPTKPQLIFVNFLHGEQMKQKSCVNNEKIGSEPLSQYYDVPSISMNDAVCSEVQKPDFKVSDIAISAIDGHPNPKNHKVMGYFLCELFKNVLRNLTNSRDNSLPSGPQLFPRREKIQKSLFKESEVFRPSCWTTLATKAKESVVVLHPLSQEGWVLYAYGEKANPDRNDIKQFWRSGMGENFITFSIELKPYKNFNCTVSLALFGGPPCGKANVYFDGDRRSAHVVDGKLPKWLILIQRVSNNIPPGKHNLTIVAQSGTFFQLSAIMTSYNIDN